MKHSLLLFGLLVSAAGFSQTTYAPVAVAVGGFNQDAVAESSPANASTTAALDQNDYVLYNQDYGTVMFTGSGLPNSGQVTNGTRSYQLQPYTQNNVMLLSTGQTDSLDLTVPASFASISLLGFATEGDATVLLVLKFTDGTATVVNRGLSDWFFSANPVIGGFDRTGRTTDQPDFQFDQPQMYAIDVDLSCADQAKTLQRILIINTTSSPTIRTAIFALSGASLLSADIGASTNVNCFQGFDGTATVASTGGAFPLTYAWSSSPVQTTEQATGLPAGTYSCIVTDAMGCPDTTTSVTLTQPATAITSSQTATICSGETFYVGTNAHTIAGTYNDVIPSSNGCDSTVTTVLTVNSVSSTGVMAAGMTLTATASGAQYQWLDCGNNFAPISGATNQTFTATADGSYAVEISQNGCTDTSVCTTVSTAGLNEWNAASVQVYPNPVSDYLTIQSPVALSSVTIADLSGKIQAVTGTMEKCYVGNLVDGIYLVRITTTEGTTAVYRIVKK